VINKDDEEFERAKAHYLEHDYLGETSGPPNWLLIGVAIALGLLILLELLGFC